MSLRAWHREHGSIPLALLVVISLSAVIGALVVTVVGSARQARFDENYTTTIQPADAGAQEGAAYLIRTVSDDDKRDAAIGTTYTGSGSTTDADGRTIPYSWVAEKVAALSWEVTSTATVNGVERVAVVEVADVPRFQFAAFSDRGFRMVGSNGADSYGTTWYTENGIVASNETIEMQGSSTGVDGVVLYDWEANQSLNRCTHNGGDDCEPVFGGCPTPDGGIPEGRSCTDAGNLPDPIPPSGRVDEPLVVGSEQLETQFIDDYLTADDTVCDSPPVDYTTSTDAPGAPLGNGERGTMGTAGVHTVLCFNNVTIDRDLDVFGTVEIYVYGNLYIGEKNHKDAQVNCDTTGCAEGTSTPNAQELTFYVDGSDDPNNPSQVKFGNGSAIAAGIYAPESVCEGNPSNAQTDIYGSLICGSISNQGGWGFHYDDRLSSIGIGLYRQRAWREEIPTP